MRPLLALVVLLVCALAAQACPCGCDVTGKCDCPPGCCAPRPAVSIVVAPWPWWYGPARRYYAPPAPRPRAVIVVPARPHRPRHR